MKKRWAVTMTLGLAVGIATIGVPAMAEEVDPGTIGAVVTFGASNGDTWAALITGPDSVADARAQLAGTADFPAHPIGTIVYTPDAVNPGWSWHLEDVAMAEMSTEVCDGKPADVERHAITSPYFCPWSAKVLAVSEL